MALLHRPLLRRAVRVGKTDESKTITVNVHLRRRPGHDPVPTFDDYLNAPPRIRIPEAEFARRFGASLDDVAAVRAHFSQFGFTMAHHMAKRRVYLTGTVGQFNKAFQVALHDYKAPHVHAHAEAPYIPDHLAHVIMRLHGLHLVKPTPHIVSSHTEGSPGPYAGLRPPVTGTPTVTLQTQIYQFPANYTGAGQAIGILFDLGNVPAIQSEIANSCSLNGVALVPTPIYIAIDGSPPPTTGGSAGWSEENTLDVTVCACFAPHAVLATIAQTNTDDYYTRLAHPHAGDPLFTIGSNSSGFSDEDVITADSTAGSIFSNYDDVYEDCAIQGVTLCNSSGDWGNSAAHPWGSTVFGSPQPAIDINSTYPATDPYVLGVGGTVIGALSGTISSSNFVEFMEGNADVNGERGLGASGGGVSIIYPVPSYQLGMAGLPSGLDT